MRDVFEVKLVAKDRIERMAAEASLPDGRYHIWFNGYTMELCVGILYKNPPLSSNTFRTRKLNANSARCAMIIAEMKRQIIDKRLVEQAIREVTKQKAAKERDARVRRTVRRYWADHMRHQPVGEIDDVTPEEFQTESGAIADYLIRRLG